MDEEIKGMLDAYVEGTVVNGDSEFLAGQYDLWESLPGISIKVFIGGVFKCKVKNDSQGNFFIKSKVRNDQLIKLVFMDSNGEFDKTRINLGPITSINKEFKEQLVKMFAL